MPNILVAGFEPFDGYGVNPSSEIAKTINGRKIHDWSVLGIEIPLDYKIAFKKLNEVVTQNSPKVILCCGQANRAMISFERIAINAINVTRADNQGYTPENDVIIPDAPAAYFSNLDLTRFVEVLKNESIPAYISYNAGTYGCNWIFFNILHLIYTGKIDAKATFIHVPPLPIQAIEKKDMSLATMPLDTLVMALEIVIQNLHLE